jgi:hypothetical protein
MINNIMLLSMRCFVLNLAFSFNYFAVDYYFIFILLFIIF